MRTDPQAHDGRRQSASPLDSLNQRALVARRIGRCDDEFLQRRVALIDSLPLQQRSRLGLRSLGHCRTSYT